MIRDLTSGTDAPTFGDVLRHWRGVRRLSQMQLALRAHVSARHISFLEVGRARPSDQMVETLGRALDLTPENQDALRTAAGFAVRYRPLLLSTANDGPMPEGEFASNLVQTALSFETALTGDDLIAAARPMLGKLGMQHFFFFSLSGQSAERDQVSFHRSSAMPERWLERYRSKRYFAIDPLIHHVRSQDSGFFWDEVPAVQRPGPSRQIFDEGKRVGLTMGYVTFLRGRDGQARSVAMLGNGTETRDHRVRFALQTLGIGMLDRLARLDDNRMRGAA